MLRGWDFPKRGQNPLVPPSEKGKLLLFPIRRALAALGKLPPGQGWAGLPPHPHLGSRPTAKVAKTGNSTSFLLFRMCFPAGQSRGDLLLSLPFPKGISFPARPALREGGHLWGRLDSAWQLPGAFLRHGTASWHPPGSSHLQALGTCICSAHLAPNQEDLLLCFSMTAITSQI